MHLPVSEASGSGPISLRIYIRTCKRRKGKFIWVSMDFIVLNSKSYENCDVIGSLCAVLNLVERDLFKWPRSQDPGNYPYTSTFRTSLVGFCSLSCSFPIRASKKAIRIACHSSCLFCVVDVWFNNLVHKHTSGFPKKVNVVVWSFIMWGYCRSSLFLRWNHGWASIFLLLMVPSQKGKICVRRFRFYFIGLDRFDQKRYVYTQD